MASGNKIVLSGSVDIMSSSKPFISMFKEEGLHATSFLKIDTGDSFKKTDGEVGTLYCIIFNFKLCVMFVTVKEGGQDRTIPAYLRLSDDEYISHPDYSDEEYPWEKKLSVKELDSIYHSLDLKELENKFSNDFKIALMATKRKTLSV